MQSKIIEIIWISFFLKKWKQIYLWTSYDKEKFIFFFPLL